MSFLLRRLSTTASGREIVRARAIDAPSILIGRDAACDVHLEDLAVNPQHAQLTSGDGRHLEIEAISGLGFELDGRRVERAEIDAADGAELRFGGHRITVGLDSEGDVPRIRLDVVRTEELSHSALDRDEAKAFSLRGLLPGRRLSAWGFTVLVLAAFLIAPIYAYMSWRGVEERPDRFHADESWISGPLSRAHRSLERDCQACHVDAFVAVRDDSCIACHDDAHDHAPADRLLAARGAPGAWQGALNRVSAAFNRPLGRCVDCHTEHEGAGPMPQTAQRFCTECHDGLSTRLTDTRIGDAGDFGTAHPQFRPRVATAPGATPRFERITWTQGIQDRNGLKFPHNTHLSRTGGVARMGQNLGMGAALECADCHRPTADRVRFQPVDMERDCAQCHSLTFETVNGVRRSLRHGEPGQVVADLYAFYRSTPPTRPLELGGMARRRPGGFAERQVYDVYFRETQVRPTRAADAVRAVFSRGGACYDCHTVFAPARGSTDWRVMPVHQTARYLTNGWFDHEPHREEECSTCHLAERSGAGTDLLLPGIATCRECHGGEGSRADVPSSCAMCHEYHAGDRPGAPWRPDEERRRQRVTAVTDGTMRQLYAGR